MQVEIEALPFCTILFPNMQIDDKVLRIDGKIVERKLYCMNMEFCRTLSERLLKEMEQTVVQEPETGAGSNSQELGI